MIQSMTGFGKATVAYKEKKINVEVKSLNSKTLDLSTRIAPLYREKEMEIRQFIAKNLERGKIDFSIWIEKDVVADATPINMALVENYYQQIKKISAQTGIPEPADWYATLLRLPGGSCPAEEVHRESGQHPGIARQHRALREIARREDQDQHRERTAADS